MIINLSCALVDNQTAQKNNFDCGPLRVEYIHFVIFCFLSFFPFCEVGNSFGSTMHGHLFRGIHENI